MSRRKRTAPTAPREWQPLARGHLKPKTPAEIDELVDSIVAEVGQDRDEALAHVLASIRLAQQDEIWMNDRYVVHLDRDPLATGTTSLPGCMHISIRRDDRKPIRDWRDMQRIKDQLAGPEREGIEIYPAASRLVDTANQFHIWVLPEGAQAPFGWSDRLIMQTSAGGTQQRPGAG